MADDGTLKKGRVSRNLIPYAGAALVVVATAGFILQSMLGGSDADLAKERALEDRAKIEAAQLSGAAVTEDAARRELAIKVESLEKEKAARDLALSASREAIVTTPPPPDMRLPPPMSAESLRAYESAKRTTVPGAGGSAGDAIVAYEDFGSGPKTFASVVAGQTGQTEGSEARVHRRQEPEKKADVNPDPNSAWSDRTGARVDTELSEYLKPEIVATKHVLLQGTVINAVTRTGLNTKLPGQMVASVSQDVYDSVKGRTLLLPKGAQLIGEYNTVVMDGQSRVMMAFTRLIFPSGASVRLGSMSASDALGVAGAEGDVNRHYIQRLGSSLVLALLANTFSQPSNITVLGSAEGSTNPKSAAGEVVTSLADEELKRAAKITPDISLKPGTKISLILAADLALPPSITNKFPTEN